MMPRPLPLLFLLAGVAGAASAQAAAGDFCRSTSPDLPSADLYCLEMVAAPGLPVAVSGHALLDLAPGPFTVPVTRDGIIRYRPRLVLGGLPAPATLDPAARSYVAWATTPLFSEWVRLGSVDNGVTEVGEVAFEQFVLVVSAESSDTVTERRGRLVLRGGSPSTRIQPPDLQQFAAGILDLSEAELRAATVPGHRHMAPDTNGWTTVPMPAGLTMLPGLMLLRPDEPARLPSPDGTIASARSPEVVRLADGDSLILVADRVRKRIHGTEHVMLGFNGQVPGPLLLVDRGTTAHIRFENRLDQPSSVHWHGLRLDAAMDGAPPVSQDPVPAGGRFDYTVRFPDAGLYWYHPHVREEMQQDLGLAGNIAVRGMAGLPSVEREEVLLLDDLLVGADGLVPWGEQQATHALMGRFGNVFLVNGEPRWIDSVRTGETLRLWFTNAANTRTFNLVIPGARLRLVAGDLGPFDPQVEVASVVLAPAERYAVDVTFEGAGPWVVVNRVRALDHLMARFFQEVDTLGFLTPAVAGGRLPSPVTIAAEPGTRDLTQAPRLSSALLTDPQPDLTLEFGLRTRDLPFVTERLMLLDSAYFHPVEWVGTMPMMNWAATAEQARWFVRNAATGGENAAAAFSVRRGDRRVLRLVNLRTSIHAMQHPIHVHGQRFLVLAVNGRATTTRAWKDTVLLPAGGTVDILVEFTNPGRWMLHCHIAEHVEAGMMTTFTVEE
jgi:FtsP/CotA-like multicopper oxidase with cupredoxin domain